jgi:hypothetical protein
MLLGKIKIPQSYREIFDFSLKKPTRVELKFFFLLLNPLAPELNHSAQRCLQGFYTADFNF